MFGMKLKWTDKIKKWQGVHDNDESDPMFRRRRLPRTQLEETALHSTVQLTQENI